MELDKETILNFLREQGDDQKATEAENELPDRVDTDADSGLLDRLGIDVGGLLERFTGGMDLPGV
jgi:hypothetical protein